MNIGVVVKAILYLLIVASIVFHRLFSMEKYDTLSKCFVVKILYNLFIFNFIIIFLCLGIFEDQPLILFTYTFCVVSLLALKLYDAFCVDGYVISFATVLFINIALHIITNGWVEVENQLLVSTFGLLLGAILVVSGFVFKTKNVRVYGLVLLLFYVIKITFIDIGVSDLSVESILTLLVSGIVCFGVSFIYNKIDRFYASEDSQNSV